MGAWGTYPKDSDGALDTFGAICDLVNNNFQTLAEGTPAYYCYAGAVMLLLQKGFHVKKTIVQKAHRLIEEHLAKTKHGLVKYDNQTEAIKSMETVLGGFNELLRNVRPRTQTILAPLGWLEREGDRNKKNWSGAGFVE